MDVRDGKITETVSGASFDVLGHFAPENLPGAAGMALRLDGYTSWVDARVGNIIPAGSKKMTAAMWVAVPSYPIIKLDDPTTEKTPIATCIDETARTGFGFYIGFDGKWSFRTYVGGWAVEVPVDTPLPTYQWNHIAAVVDSDAKTITVYNNGQAVASGRCNGTVSVADAPFTIGRGKLENYMGPFLLTSFNGLVDDITVWNEALPAASLAAMRPENPANLDIPASRFADDILRPRFHGMPAAAWTNECHGMAYADGRYHLFFQKNADGPYMARLHWGHISSENLYDWREEKIALAPGEPYDIKGCWSGCVFTDEQITSGKPNIIYTAVDYVKATIAQAIPDDESLLNWTKKPGNPIIGPRPSTLTDDFRDPYFFRNGSDAYIIVGSSKGGLGTASLHKYNPATAMWSSDGSLFFIGSNAATDGNFWEMPTITPMNDGKWLFTATPLSTSAGTKTIYWTGSISPEGKFVPDARSSQPRDVELVARSGFGLLSPTIFPHDGKTIVLGIVPDKLGAQENWNLGWAHCYSLPREWSLGADGSLVQKPFEGLKGLRTTTSFSRKDFALDGAMPLGSVEGREVELSAVFTLANAPVGFNFFKNAAGEASLRYDPSRGTLTLDFSSVRRLINDGGVFGGVYSCSLPETLRPGDNLSLDVFIDHSIIDIFVNDRWATSVRIFATDSDASGVEAFAGASTQVQSLDAWVLSPREGQGSGVDAVVFSPAEDAPFVDVYNLSGACVRHNAPREFAVEGLAPGVYFAGGRKLLVR